jgi:hypothetical protein
MATGGAASGGGAGGRGGTGGTVDAPADPADRPADARTGGTGGTGGAGGTGGVDARPPATGGVGGGAPDAGAADLPTADAPPAAGDPEPGRLAGMTARHNQVRASVGVPPLVWDPAVAATAQAYADRCMYQHSGASGLGENIAAFAPPGSLVSAAVDAWAGERADYDYAANTCAAGKMCGHYTQIVWRTTTRLGCGVATCDVNTPFGPRFPRWDFWVCNYAPPGNVNGRRPY